MGVWNMFIGRLKVEITCASQDQFISTACDIGISLFDLEQKDQLTISCTVTRKQYALLERLVARMGGAVKVLYEKGLYFHVRSLKARPIFLFGVALLLCLTVFIPTRVFFIYVEGNHQVPTYCILDKAEACGLKFGASRRMLRSEQVKNQLLSEIPQLQWVGVNTRGCVAVISVDERTEISQEESEGRVGSIIAQRDGIIQEITVVRGNALCTVGQAVQKGQVLVSGYTDCGIVIKAELAEAEVYALTKRELTAVTPVDYRIRGRYIGRKNKYRLKFGKKSMKLYKDSGISDSTCVRIYTERYITLPGGFQLPLAVVNEALYYYEEDEICINNAEDCPWLREYVDAYLHKHMTAGKILNAAYQQQSQGDIVRQIANYACLEMIGQIHVEERYQINGKRDGKDY